ncbi:MAG TPA: beta-propeller fold lactonase family protein [Chloroflexota bacterium]|jgi:6-phosphogluconolactonase (cycloisomerase 2 family)
MITFRRQWSLSLPAGMLLAVALLFGVNPAAAGAPEDEDDVAGHVYVLNNNLAGSNSITTFARAANGVLTEIGVTDIGGTGSLAAFADGTQGSLIRTPNGRRLFAADLGSDEISVVDVHDGRLSLVGVFKSGGAGPVSLTYDAGLLYVLNAANASPSAANVTGFRVDDKGALHAIPGSTRPLSGPHPNPAQVQLDPQHRFLVVTEKSTGQIDIYKVAPDGSLSGPTVMPSVGAYPFGMALGARQELVVADAGTPPTFIGAATAYRLMDGQLTPINGPVPDHQIAPCWMVITNNSRFAYTSNADSHAISGYRIHEDGTISLLDADGVTGSTPADTFPLEEGLSRNSRFLYVLDSRLLLPTPGAATISGFRVHADGHLTPVVDESTITLPFSAIGLASD